MREVVRRLDPSVRALAIPQEPTAEQCRGALSRLATLDSRSRGLVLAVAAALNSDPDRLVDCERTSPGEMRKLMLGLGMLDAPELIIMDEPSNYLDLHSVEALERLLAAFPGALLLVSHDAALLEATTSVCWEISESSPETSAPDSGLAVGCEDPQEAALPCRLCAAFPLTERGCFRHTEQRVWGR